MDAVSLGGVSDGALAAYDANWAVCEETAAAHGQSVDRRDFRVAIFMHLADSAEKAVDDLGADPDRSLQRRNHGRAFGCFLGR